MLKFNYKDLEIINPNEEIRNKCRQLLDSAEQSNLNQYYYFKMIINSLQINDEAKFISIVSVIYKDVYTYLNFCKKIGENSLQSRYEFSSELCATNIEEVIECYNRNSDFFIDNFIYILDLNNLFFLKLLLELDLEQNENLQKIFKTHIFDMMALNQDINLNTLLDFYNMSYSDTVTTEELAKEIKDFLMYLQHKNKDFYKKFIYEISKEIYSWSRYYVDNSINVTEDDFEVEIIKFIEQLDNTGISIYFSIDNIFLVKVLTYILEINEISYQNVITKNGKEKITKEKVVQYMKNYTKK